MKNKVPLPALLACALIVFISFACIYGYFRLESSNLGQRELSILEQFFFSQGIVPSIINILLSFMIIAGFTWSRIAFSVWIGIYCIVGLILIPTLLMALYTIIHAVVALVLLSSRSANQAK